MKVYVVGAHSVGKTTLARYISNKYHLPMIPEVARTILAEKELSIDTLRTDLNAVNDYQRSIFLRQLTEEAKETGFVSDRSFDCLCYTAQHSEILSEILALDELKNYIESLKNHDVLVFFVRPCKETMRQDGVRETLNWEGVIQIDAHVKFMLEMWNIPHIQINTPSMQERARLIDSVMNKVLIM